MLERNQSTGELFVDGVSVQDLAQKYGTPLYVYSENQLRKNCQKLVGSASKYFDGYRVQFAVKANNNPHLLEIIKSESLGADCSSPLELRLAHRMGFDFNKSTYTGNYESKEDLRRAVESGIVLNLDDYNRLDDVLQFGVPKVLSFRINPGIGKGGFEQIITGGTDAKFGISYEETRNAYQKAIDAGVKRFGIHMMTGSNILEPFYFAEITQKLFSIISENLCDLGIELEFINIGGGFGIPYTEDEEELDLDHAFKLVGEIFEYHKKKLNIGNPDLVVEPGRFVIANAGVVLSEVTHVKRSYKNYVGLDAGMTTLIRPAMYKAFHKVHLNGKREGEAEDFLICGQICENSDIHPAFRKFQSPQAGDIAVIQDAGAYGYTMSSNYNNRVRTAEVLIDKNAKDHLIRHKEREEQLFELIPEFTL